MSPPGQSIAVPSAALLSSAVLAGLGPAVLAPAAPAVRPSPMLDAAAITPVSTAWTWPLAPVPDVVRGFLPPAHPWEPGHRGVDLLGHLAEPVMSIGAGTISFARPVAGRGVVVVDHGGLRSSYEPVTASLHVGEHVGAGTVIGLLQATQSHCFPEVCLHLGLRRGERYLDPMYLFGPLPVRLKPLTGGAPGALREPAYVAARTITTWTDGGLRPPPGSRRAPLLRLASAVGADVAAAIRALTLE